MIGRRTVRTMAAVLATALALGIPAGEAHAKKRKKSTISAIVNGKKLKSSGRLVTGSLSEGFFFLAGTARKGKSFRTIGISCAPFFPEMPPTLPFQCDAVGPSYQEYVNSRPSKIWGPIATITVFIDFFDGVRIKGRFSGGFDSGFAAGTNAPLGPIQVENGVFDFALPK